jgi:tRNA (guanine-N7-)-methyltransferase
MSAGEGAMSYPSALQPLRVEPALHSPPFDWVMLFRNTNPVEIEIGCGKGMFLKETSHLHPDVNYLGVEWANKYLRVAEERLSRAGRANVRLMRADGLDVLQRWVAPGSVRVLHIYFPDPWPKKRHHKRRLLRPAFLELAARALIPGGEIRLATDNDPYAEVIRALLEDWRARFSPADWPADDPDRLPTNYACKWQRQGRPLWWARYRLLSG